METALLVFIGILAVGTLVYKLIGTTRGKGCASCAESGSCHSPQVCEDKECRSPK